MFEGKLVFTSEDKEKLQKKAANQAAEEALKEQFTQTLTSVLLSSSRWYKVRLGVIVHRIEFLELHHSAKQLK